MKLAMCALTIVQLSFSAGLAHAESPPCGPVSMSYPEAIDPAFRREAESFCAGASSLPDIEQDASVSLEPGDPLLVRVLLRDGRRAERHVAAPSALRHTLEGLLTRPPPPPTPAPIAEQTTRPGSSSPTPGAAAGQVREATRAPDGRGSRSAASPDVSPDVSPEVGAMLVGRVLGAPLHGAIGAQAWVDLDVSDWLFGLDVRWDPYVTTDAIAGFHMTSVGGGAWVGRRFARVDRLALDVALGVQVVEEIQAAPVEDPDEEGEPAAGDDRDEAAGASTDVRPALSLAAHWGGEGTRASAGVGFEVSPARLATPERLAAELPTLPSWGVMAGMGVSWGRP